MRRWMLFLPVAALTVFAGWLGLRLGSFDVSDAVAAAGRDWTARGGDPAQCTGLAGDGVAWVSVICGAGADGRLYQFDRLGRMAISPLADPADAARPAT